MPRITITIPERTPQPYRFQLERPTVTLGRGSDNDIAIDCRSVSVKHAEMVRVPGGYELRDVGSTNGIKLDGQRQEVIALRNDQAVTLGDVVFEFVLTEEEEQILRRENPESVNAAGTPEETPAKVVEDSPSPAPKRPKPVKEPAQGGGGGCAMLVLFLILAVAAFFAGMAIRYQKDTGSSLLDAIRNRGKVVVPAAKSR